MQHQEEETVHGQGEGILGNPHTQTSNLVIACSVVKTIGVEIVEK